MNEHVKAALYAEDAARSLAIQLHPEVADMLTRKKDFGMADSILIARFG